MPDKDGYPTEKELQAIREWDYRKGFRDLIHLLIQLWSYPDRVRIYKSKNWCGESIKKLYLSIGGWSGNEDIIMALQENYIFWTMHWIQTKRGGHYWFEMPKPKK